MDDSGKDLSWWLVLSVQAEIDATVAFTQRSLAGSRERLEWARAPLLRAAANLERDMAALESSRRRLMSLDDT